MNLNSISPMSDDFDEYPEINQANLDISIRHRNFYNRHHEYIYGQLLFKTLMSKSVTLWFG
jgi:hypothetical protein